MFLVKAVIYVGKTNLQKILKTLKFLGSRIEYKKTFFQPLNSAWTCQYEDQAL